jgi:DNA mismatch repair protein MutL
VSQEVAVLPKEPHLRLKPVFQHPARRNFLKSDTVEYRHIVDEFQRSFSTFKHLFHFYHNGSEMFNLPASSLRQQLSIYFLVKPIKTCSSARRN